MNSLYISSRFSVATPVYFSFDSMDSRAYTPLNISLVLVDQLPAFSCTKIEVTAQKGALQEAAHKVKYI